MRQPLETLEPETLPLPGIALATLVAAQLMIILDTTVVTIALPRIRTDLDFSATGLSWVLTLYTVTFGGLLLLGGRLGDLFGRRRTLHAGLALFTAASVLAGCAPGAGWLLVARGLQGAGGALAAPSVLALIATIFTGERRMRALAVFSTVTGAGLAAGLLLGGALTQWASWRWVFWINVPIGVILVAVLPRTVPVQPGKPARIDYAGAISGTTAAAALVYALTRAADAGWTDPWTLAAGALAILAVATFALVERHTPAPMLPIRLLADQARIAAYVVAFGLPAAMFGIFFFMGQYLQFVRGASALETGLAFLPMAVAQVTTIRLTPKLLARFGPTVLVTFGALLITAASGWLSLLGADSPYAALVLGPMILLGTGVGLAFMPLNTVIVTGAGADSGAASGLLQTLQQLGGAIGLAALVTVFHHGDTFAHGAALAFRTSAAFTLVAAAIAYLGLRRPSQPAVSREP